MIEYIQENKRIFIILISSLFIFVIVLYFLILRPLIADVSLTEDQIAILEHERDLLQEKIDHINKDVPDLNVEQLIFENKIPTERELDKYILALQQYEATADSKIERIEFIYDSNFDINQEEQGTSESLNVDSEIDTESTEELDDEEHAEEVGEIVDPIIMKEKPDGLEVLVVRVDGHSKKLEDFIQFLKSIEIEERISIVTRLNFVQPTRDDINFAENPRIALSFTAELTTFYYPE